jgi:hypothetical protein
MFPRITDAKYIKDYIAHSSIRLPRMKQTVGIFDSQRHQQYLDKIILLQYYSTIIF